MRSLKSKVTALLAVFVSGARSTAYSRSKFIVDSFVNLFRVGILLLVYMNIYAVAPQANSVLPYVSALWSIGLYFVAMSFMARRMYLRVSALIYSGNIETYLVRPMHVLIFTGVRLLGENLLQVLSTVVIVLGLLIVTVGFPTNTVSVPLLLGGLFLLLTGVLIELLLATFVGIFAIWLERADPIWWIFDKLVLILGGSYVPVAFFPDILKKMALYSPFGATRFITYALYPNFDGKLLQYALVQVFWVSVLLGLIAVVFRNGQKHLFVNGS